MSIWNYRNLIVIRIYSYAIAFWGLADFHLPIWEVCGFSLSYQAFIVKGSLHLDIKTAEGWFMPEPVSSSNFFPKPPFKFPGALTILGKAIEDQLFPGYSIRCCSMVNFSVCVFFPLLLPLFFSLLKSQRKCLICRTGATTGSKRKLKCFLFF